MKPKSRSQVRILPPGRRPWDVYAALDIGAGSAAQAPAANAKTAIGESVRKRQLSRLLASLEPLDTRFPDVDTDLPELDDPEN